MDHEGDVVVQDGVATQPAKTNRRLILGAFGVAALAVLVLVVADILVVRGPAERAFMSRNAECLRCHSDLVGLVRRTSVHQPFLRKQCTSCHTRHGERRVVAYMSGDFSAWRWLQAFLERIYLEFVWRILSGPALISDTAGTKAAATTLSAEATSSLVGGEAGLCWQCHPKEAASLHSSSPHPPFEKSQCTSCHDAHASNYAPLLHGSTADVCVSCHRIGPELIAADVHLPFGQRRCTSCHAAHGSSYAGMLLTDQRKLCIGCHDSIAALDGASHRHAPFQEGCTPCHRPHSAPVMSLLKKPTPTLCIDCHPKTVVEFASASHHPLGKLDCPDCHQPHASDWRGLLPVTQRQLCLNCHGRVRVELTRRHLHAVVGKGDCTTCHRPHGSPDAPLLQASDPALCYRCHARIGRGVVRRRTPKRVLPTPKFTVTDLGRRPAPTVDPITDPVRTPAGPSASSHPIGFGMRCTSCHEAHASDPPGLLVASGNTLCLRCHASAARAFGASAHGGLECLRCHYAHTSGQPSLLVARNPELCLRCHAEYARSPDFHPVDPAIYDTYARTAFTCTSTCHDPHGSRYHRMLRVPYEVDGKGSDYICLLCHTKVGVQY